MTSLVGQKSRSYATPMPSDGLTTCSGESRLASAPLRILALLHSPPCSGSDTTIRRIIGHLAELGHCVVSQADPADSAELARLAAKHDADALIGTHAFLSGRTFVGSDLPYALILGGTDVNELSTDPDCFEIMTSAVDGAAAVVVLNEDFKHRALRTWPGTAGKLYHIPQGVRTGRSNFSIAKYLSLPAESKFFLLPSGIRPVKDPLFLLDGISRWHLEDPQITLVIAGLAYEPGYHELALRRIGVAAGVRYAGALAQPDLHAAMRDATAVLNTSLSECSPNAVLEAMDLGCPVLVRDIPGNTCLVEHERTGLVFGTPGDFEAQARRLIADPGFARSIAVRGQQHVRRSHSLDAERTGYAAVVRALAGRHRQSRHSQRI